MAKKITTVAEAIKPLEFVPDELKAQIAEAAGLDYEEWAMRNGGGTGNEEF